MAKLRKFSEKKKNIICFASFFLGKIGIIMSQKPPNFKYLIHNKINQIDNSMCKMVVIHLKDVNILHLSNLIQVEG